MAVKPITALKNINLRLFPSIGIPLIDIYVVANMKEPKHLKNTIWNEGILSKYFTETFISAKEKVLIIIKSTAFLKSTPECFANLKIDNFNLFYW